MEAHLLRCAVLVAAVASMGASYRTNNFLIEAPSPQMAKQIGDAAEAYRRDLAIDWLGKEMPNWSQPCPITAHVADHLGAGGATSFVFEHGEVFGWKMTIQGSLVRVLDSVLPHEVTHTIFATHFRRPLPRWADEGACTTVEHVSERNKQQAMLVDFLRTERGIPFRTLFAMKEYPQDVMPLYSQGYSLARYLIAQGGKQKFLEFVGDGMRDENWNRATQKYYGHGLDNLQNTWLAWVRKGSPKLDTPTGTPSLVTVSNPGPSVVADNSRRSRPEPNLIYHGQVADVGPVDDKTGPAPDGASTRPAPSNGDESPAGGRAAVASNNPRPAWSYQPNDGWRSSGPPATTDLAKNDDQAGKTPGAVAASEVDSSQYQVTRPQPYQRPRQVILEWDRAPGDNGGAPNTRPGPIETAGGPKLN